MRQLTTIASGKLRETGLDRLLHNAHRNPVTRREIGILDGRKAWIVALK